MTDGSRFEDFNKAISRFDAAAQDWGWQADQGHNGDTIARSAAEYKNAKAGLIASADSLVQAERERCAQIAENIIVSIAWSDESKADEVAQSCIDQTREFIAMKIRHGEA